MSRCPYPHCFRHEHEDGDHQLGRPPKPSGSLRPLQEFIQGRRSTPPCDFHNGPTRIPAVGFYVDMFGLGWMLCYPCVRKFGAVEEFSTSRPATSILSTKSTKSTHHSRVIQFRARQEVKA